MARWNPPAVSQWLRAVIPSQFRRIRRRRRAFFVICATVLLTLWQKSRPMLEQRSSNASEISLGRASQQSILESWPVQEKYPDSPGVLASAPALGFRGKVPKLMQDESILENTAASARGSGSARVDAFPNYVKWSILDKKAEALPDIIHIPFEDVVADMKLTGFEDEWISNLEYDVERWGSLEEPKIDFLYTWVNGSDEAFSEMMRDYELNSTLNDSKGKWLSSHRLNRYREWDELRYSMRSVEKYAGSFRNNIQILVNAVKKVSGHGRPDHISRQRPLWLSHDRQTSHCVHLISQEEFFGEDESGGLPTFNSLTIENQIFNTKSDVDRFFALSDDMFLGQPNAASDIYSPLFGPTMAFKPDFFNTIDPPTDEHVNLFGEKPFLIYTSWLLNRRFGNRKRPAQAHFGHSLSRTVAREAINSFPRPALRSATQRFRGEYGFQLYSWYAMFHYTIERHREVLLWSYIMLRSDFNGNGYLGWDERQAVMSDLEEGIANEGKTAFRERAYDRIGRFLEKAGLEAPKANLDTKWTSLDGPEAIRDIECFEFDVNECLAPGFSILTTDDRYLNPVFSTATIFDRVSRQNPMCGDCLIKLLLNRVKKGLSPLLPEKSQAGARETVIKAITRYQYTIIEPNALFMMITDAKQVEDNLISRLKRDTHQFSQLCLNDDVATDDKDEVEGVRRAMTELLQMLYPEQSQFELRS